MEVCGIIFFLIFEDFRKVNYIKGYVFINEILWKYFGNIKWKVV